MFSHSDRRSDYTIVHGEVKLVSPGLGLGDGQRLRAAPAPFARILHDFVSHQALVGPLGRPTFQR
jgi:hypothetical protein